MATHKNFVAQQVVSATVSAFVYSLIAGYTTVGAIQSLRKFYTWANRL